MSNAQRAADQATDQDVGSVTGTGVIDWLPLQEMAAHLGEDAPLRIQELIGTFSDSAPDLIRQIAAALDSPALGSAEEPAHALRGSSLCMGADRLAAAAGRIERGVKNGRPVVEMRLLLRRAAAEMSYVEDALEHLPEEFVVRSR